MRKKLTVLLILLVSLVLVGCQFSKQGQLTEENLDEYIKANFRDMTNAMPQTGVSLEMMLLKSEDLAAEIPTKDGLYILEPDQEYLVVANIPQVLEYDERGEHSLLMAFNRIVVPATNETEMSSITLSVTGDEEELYMANLRLAADTACQVSLAREPEPGFNQNGWFRAKLVTVADESDNTGVYYGEDDCPYGLVRIQIMDTEVLREMMREKL